MSNAPVLALDLGGTKLSTAIVDPSGRVLYRKKFPVERGHVRVCVEQLVTAIEDATGSLAIDQPVQAIGMIVPGIYFPKTGNVWASNLWGHEEVALRSELERRVSVPLVIDNDRAGYVLGEQWLGAARGVSDVVFLAVGTGIGAGIIADGRLLRGFGQVAGAVGWFALTTEQRDIYNSIGCFEAEAAGPGLARRAGMESAEQVVSAARHGHTRALRAIEETARYLGAGIANLVSLLNPELVVLGGGLLQAADLFLDTVKDVMAQWAQPVAARQVRIELTTLGEDAGLFGAARLALQI